MTYTDINANLTGVEFGSVAWGDFDGDDDLDLLLTGGVWQKNAKIYNNDGSGGFTEDTAASANLTGVGYSSVATGDYNGDGDLDLLITGQDSSNNPIAKIYNNDGSGGFTEDTAASANLIGVVNSSVATGDFDGDDDLDLLITGDPYGHVVSKIYVNDGSGGFTENTTANLAGVTLGSVTTGDFDGDNDLDLLITGWNEIAKIYDNDGSGNFTEDTTASANLTGVDYDSAVATGDFDGDGDLDLLISALDFPNRTTKIYDNDGSGNFTEDTTANLTGVSRGSVMTGDYDNDGDLDLLVTGDDSNVLPNTKIYINDGSGNFTEDTIANLANVSRGSVATGDIDGDGDSDFILTGQSNSGPFAEIYRNDNPVQNNPSLVGHWTFEEGATLTDLTGNFGDLTLVNGASISNGQLDVNSGQFANASNYTGPTITDKTLVSWVSLDNLNVRSGSALTIDSPSVDRFDAIVYGERQPNRWMPGSSYFHRTQDPVPGFAETVPNQLVQMAITYEDNGGSPDISIYRNGELIGNYTQGSTASWSAGDAEVIFGARHTGGTTFPIGTLEARIEEAMIFDEVLTQEQIQQLTPDLNENTGTGNFTDSGQNLGSSDSTDVELIDLDGDGDLDAFVANGSLQGNKVWLNDGNGIFTDSGQNLGSLTSLDSSLGDVDGDGDLDAFAANASQGNKVWLNDGNGTFTNSGQSLGSFYSNGVDLADLDGDGDLDAFVSNTIGQPNKVWLNDGNGTFTDSGQFLGNSNSDYVDLGDVDGDGDLDAFVANVNQPNKVWLNDGNGTFTDSGQSLGSFDSKGVDLGDLDGDGDLDAFVVNFRSLANKVWLNDGNGTFTDSGQSLGNSQSYGVTLEDLDADGDIDAFVTNHANQPNEVYLNDGTGSFTDSDQSLGNSTSWRSDLADVDGNGSIDAFVANLNGSNEVWLNEAVIDF